MAEVSFEMIGRLILPKESEKFKPFEDKESQNSNWVSRRLMFNLLNGDNRHSLTVRGGCFNDDKGEIYTFSQSTKDTNGKRVAGEKMTIPFSDRMNPKYLETVANYKKLVLDLEVPRRRYLLTQAAQKLKDGGAITETELAEMGAPDVKSIDKELELSKAKRFDFISEWDYAEKLYQVLQSEEYKNKKFRVTGRRVTEYSTYSGKFYTNYEVNRAYLYNDDSEDMATASMKFYYNKDSLDTGLFEETGSYIVNGFTLQYNRELKEDIPCPQIVTLSPETFKEKEKCEAILELYKSQFVVTDNSWKELGVVVDLIDGAQKMALDYELLSDFEKQQIDIGIMTLEEMQKKKDGVVYGERVTEDRFKDLGKGFTSGRNDTIYEDSYFDLAERFTKQNTEDDDDMGFLE